MNEFDKRKLFPITNGYFKRKGEFNSFCFFLDLLSYFILFAIFVISII